MSHFTIRPVTDAEYPAFAKAIVEGFADDLPSDEFVDYLKANLPPERTLAAFDGEDIVGTFGGYDLNLTVPGGASLGMEGTTIVTVYPTHRRMGLLRDMMRAHLDNAVAAGYPLAGLWASESGIYQRFGYGIATHCYSVKMDGNKIRFRDDIEIDRVRRVDIEDAIPELSPVFDAVSAITPGMWSRSQSLWEEILFDGDWTKRGRTKFRIVVHDGPDGPDGYAVYRLKSGDSDDWHDAGTVAITEVIAATPRAEASLWAFLTNVDMCPNVSWPFFPVEDSLGEMLVESRRIQRTFKHEALYVRILDVEAALTARTYEYDGDIVLGIVDPFRPDASGRYRLTTRDGSSTCVRTDDNPDVSMDIEVLGALYLGGQSAYAYADANRISGNDNKIDTLHRILHTARAPYCGRVF